MKNSFTLFLFFMLISGPVIGQVSSRAKRPVAKEKGKFFEKDGKKMLWGGKEDHQHFDITGYDLKDEQFHYGIGRERFPALIKPEFISIKEAKKSFKKKDRFLFVKLGNTSKAYAITDLTRHEVVNDEIEGQPVMASYCILADLGAMYDRTFDGKVFTFALSGYTYYDDEVWDGLDGFVFWDRETESLWWPLIGKAVSGPMQGAELSVMNEKHWKQTTWKDIKKHHKNAQVLKPNQDFTPPENWPKYNEVKTSKASGKKIAPRWGKNKSIEN